MTIKTIKFTAHFKEKEIKLLKFWDYRLKRFIVIFGWKYTWDTLETLRCKCFDNLVKSYLQLSKIMYFLNAKKITELVAHRHWIKFFPRFQPYVVSDEAIWIKCHVYLKSIKMFNHLNKLFFRYIYKLFNLKTLNRFEINHEIVLHYLSRNNILYYT